MKQLKYGIEYSGAWHCDFALRLPTIGDNIDALTDAGAAGDLAVNVALLACCLVSLGEIPKETLTYEFLRSHLVDDDYDVLWAELAEVKKKRLQQSCAPKSSSSEVSP